MAELSAAPTTAASDGGRDETASENVPTSTAGAGAARAALVALWDKHRDTNLERVAVLENVAAAANANTLDDALREEGTREAHKLAGSLGTFGIDEGTRLARVIERALETRELDHLSLSRAVVAIRDAITSGSPASAAVGAAPAPRSEPNEGAVRVLIVSSEVRLTTGVSLAAPGTDVDVHVVGDVDAARSLAESQAWDVFAVDLATDGASALLGALSDADDGSVTFAIGLKDGFADRVDAARLGARGFLSRALTPHQMLAAIARLKRGRESQTARILVVDDDEVMRDHLSQLLGDQELDVACFEDPLELWRTLEEELADLLIVDVDMPDVDGILLCQVVRADPRWQRLPILVLTAHTDDETMRAAFAAGADDYLAKPVLVPELLSRVRAHVERGTLVQMLAETDGLTGVQNRWRCEEALAHLLRLAGRHNETLALAIIDLDRFKQVNDRWGHAMGDEVLRRFGKACLSTFRGEDVIGRWGGEEFVVAMYGSETRDCVERTAELLESFRSEPFNTESNNDLHVSFSAGVAQFPLDATDLDGLYRVADEALGRAKLTRGRVVAAGYAQRDEDRPNGVHDVLVVEDDEPLADLLVHAIRTRGYDVVHLGDGAEAAAQLTSGDVRANLVLLDIGLPGLDGFAVLRQLRDRGVLKNTKVIALTARSSEVETLRALELGATDHIPKPFSVPVLMRRIHRALERRE